MLAYSISSALHFSGVSRPLHRVIYIVGDADASILYHQRSLIRIHGNRSDHLLNNRCHFQAIMCSNETIWPKMGSVYVLVQCICCILHIKPSLLIRNFLIVHTVALIFCFKGTVHPKIRDIYFSSYLWIVL